MTIRIVCRCPPNLARTLAQTSEYAYAVDADGVWTGLYGANEACFTLKNGAAFRLTQQTAYPYDERITFAVSQSNGVPFWLHLRVPAWAEEAELTVRGENRRLQCGEYTVIDVTQPADFTCALELHMKPRLTVGHGLIEEDRNQACVEVGPLVYCIEMADVPSAVCLHDLLLPLLPDFHRTQVEIDGRSIPALETTLLCQQMDEKQRERLYRTFGGVPLRPCRERLIPYFAWDNRGMGEMLVWLPLAWREL